MAKPTKIKFGDFFKAVQHIAIEKGYSCRVYNGKRASAIGFQFFVNGNDVPIKIFSVHEDKKMKVIYTDDLKKFCKFFELTPKQFGEYIDNGFNFPEKPEEQAE